MRLIDANALKKQIEDFNCKDCNHYNFVRCRACQIDDALSYIDDAPTVGEWISVKDRMPTETHSMFYKFYGTPKWRNAMWREESDNVLVAITFEDGSRFVTSGYTQDGRWSTGISKILQYTVTHWMPLPTPPEVIQE